MNETTVALSFVLAVLVVATVSSMRVAIAASLVAFACFNFFFLPPVGTFTIAKTDDLVALLTLLAVSLIGSHLSQEARRRARETLAFAQERNAAEMIRKSAEAKSALVASLSHDLKTPLTALTVAAGNLGIAGLTEHERAEQIQLVRSELERLTRLFDNVLDLASLEARSMNAELQWVEPSDVIDAARQQVDTALAVRRINVTDHAVDYLVQLDPRLTSAALAHVLENAAAYSPVEAPIAIDISIRAANLVIQVRDQGPGLRIDEIDRVFDRFYRGSATAHSPFNRGLGLAITRGLVAIQGGQIRAGNHPDGGAIFTLEIPALTRATSDLAVDIA
jgi:two-component system, OmpR family, sensor histidine kinase KdpD